MEENIKFSPLATKKISPQLYVSGMSLNSMEAIENIKIFCEKHLSNSYDLEIIDIYKNPECAMSQQIIYSPSLIKVAPLPRKVLIGNFSDTGKVMDRLGLT